MARQGRQTRKPQPIAEPTSQRKPTFIVVCSLALILGAAIAYGVMATRTASGIAEPVQEPASAASHFDLLATPAEHLGQIDVALMNLLCAKGLPGAESLDIPAILAKLDEWAAKVKFETQRHLYRVTDPKYAEHYNHSEARLRAEFIVQVLQEDCGVRHNEDRIQNVDFANAADLFIHGMVNGDHGGTCASMPVLYAAVGRRLGYPIKLVLAKQHVFCRWDDGADRFNIEGATNGGVSYFPDEHYRTWPRPISDAEMKSGEFLRALTPQEELATFLLNRGACLEANGSRPEAMACLAEAHRLMPEAITPMIAMRSALSKHGGMRVAQQRRLPWEDPAIPAEMRRQMAPVADPRPAGFIPGHSAPMAGVRAPVQPVDGPRQP